jgi:hypothetical protein
VSRAPWRPLTWSRAPRGASRAALVAGVAVVVVGAIDSRFATRAESQTRNAGRAADATHARPAHARLHTACAGERPPLPDVLFYDLQSGAFPDSGHPDVAVHVPPGFDATLHPGLVLYFRGWNQCVASALADSDIPCSDDGEARPALSLATQIDDARVNALLVAPELRFDLPSGEPGQLGNPGGLRALLDELFSGRLADDLGCSLDVDALDRVMIVSHSGGYQAAASALALGDVPRIVEVDLLDSLYGADEVFTGWIAGETLRFDPRVDDSVRFVDLYTCCGGTVDRSRSMAQVARDALGEAGLADLLFDDDGEDDLAEEDLAHPLVFKRVPRDHSELPRAYVRALVESAGFEHVLEPGIAQRNLSPASSHSQRPK